MPFFDLAPTDLQLAEVGTRLVYGCVILRFPVFQKRARADIVSGSHLFGRDAS